MDALDENAMQRFKTKLEKYEAGGYMAGRTAVERGVPRLPQSRCAKSSLASTLTCLSQSASSAAWFHPDAPDDDVGPCCRLFLPCAFRGVPALRQGAQAIIWAPEPARGQAGRWGPSPPLCLVSAGLCPKSHPSVCGITPRWSSHLVASLNCCYQ